MAHRIISRDGYEECFACGIVVERVSDGDTTAAFDAFVCVPGGYAHPPYVIPVPGKCEHEPQDVLIETCASHPYEDEAIVAYA